MADFSARIRAIPDGEARRDGQMFASISLIILPDAVGVTDPAQLSAVDGWPAYIAAKPLTLWWRTDAAGKAAAFGTIQTDPATSGADLRWKSIFMGQMDALKRVLIQDQNSTAPPAPAGVAIKTYEAAELARAMEWALYGEAATVLAAGLLPDSPEFAGVRPFKGVPGSTGLLRAMFPETDSDTPIDRLRSRPPVGRGAGHASPGLLAEIFGSAHPPLSDPWVEAFRLAAKGDAVDFGHVGERLQALGVSPSTMSAMKVYETALARAMTNPKAWTSGDYADEDRPTIDAIKTMSAKFLVATRKDPEPRSAVHEAGYDVDAAVRRKLTGLQSQPTLARAFGLGGSATFVPPGGVFQIAVTPGADEPGADTVWCACRMTPLGLIAATRAEVYPGTPDLEAHAGGQLDLTALSVAPARKGSRRFEVVSLQPRNAVEAGYQKVVASLAQASQGGEQNGGGERQPELRTAGIGVIDRDRKEAIEREIAAGVNRKDRILCSEDITVGYRFDLGILSGGDFQWRSLTDRTVSYADAPKPLPPAWRQEREHGFVRPLIREPSRDSADVDPIAYQTLATFTGASLAIPAAAGVVEVTNPLEDLAASSERSLPDVGPARLGLMPLRFGRTYRAGMRLAYQNGCGLTLAQATTLYKEGKGVSADIPFLRYEEIQSPIVLVAVSDPVLSARYPGDSDRTVVLRAGSVNRFLAAPAVPFDFAELHGVFDASGVASAFTEYERDAKSGKFIQLPERKPVAMVAKPGDSRRAAPYFPDPLAETLVATFVRDGENPTFFSSNQANDEVKVKVEFNPRKEWPRGARLVPLKVTSAKGDWPRATLKATNGEISVTLAPGEEIELWCWSAPTSAQSLAQHNFFNGVRSVVQTYLGVTQETGFQAAAADTEDRTRAFSRLLSTLTRTGSDTGPTGAGRFEAEARLAEVSPRPGLSTPLKLRLVNPVEKPKVPRFEVSGGRSLSVVRLGREPLPSPSAPSEVKASRAIWETFLSERRDTGEVGATRTYFAGDIQVDAPATGQVRLTGVWRDHSDTMAFSIVGPEKWAFSPKYVPIELFAFENPKRLPAWGASHADLSLNVAPDGSETLRSYDFGDTKARLLDVTIGTRSRYTGYYKTGDDDPPDRFETSSVTQGIWIPATARPPAPVLSGPEVLPVFTFRTEQSALPNGRRFEITRETHLRVHLKRPWHESGEGELLGLVFATSRLFSPDPAEQSALSTAERNRPVDAQDKNPVEPFTTRRGHDPLYQSGRLDRWLTVDRLKLPKPPAGMWTEKLLPFELSSVDGRAPAEARVSVWGVAPEPDLLAGEWIANIQVDPDQAYAPFLRLGLCRVQPHAIRDQELSQPVTAWAKLAPKRTMTVTVEGALVKLVLGGQGYIQTNAGKHAEDPRTHRPSLAVTLMRRTAKQDWVAVPDTEDDALYEYKDLAPEFDQGMVLWKGIEFKLPGEGHFGLLVTEYGYMAADGSPGESEVLRMSHRTFVSMIDLKSGAAWSDAANSDAPETPKPESAA